MNAFDRAIAVSIGRQRKFTLGTDRSSSLYRVIARFQLDGAGLNWCAIGEHHMTNRLECRRIAFPASLDTRTQRETDKRHKKTKVDHSTGSIWYLVFGI